MLGEPARDLRAEIVLDGLVDGRDRIGEVVTLEVDLQVADLERGEEGSAGALGEVAGRLGHFAQLIARRSGKHLVSPRFQHAVVEPAAPAAQR